MVADESQSSISLKMFEFSPTFGQPCIKDNAFLPFAHCLLNSGPSCSKAGKLCPVDNYKSLSDSFNLCKDLSISSCTSEYAHSNQSSVGECTKTLDNI